MKLLVFFLLLFGTQAIFEATCNCECEELDRNTLGQSTWYLLHEIVKHVPPNEHFSTFLESLSYVYPCKECRDHIKTYLSDHKVEMSKKWVCDFHNEVNRRLNKDEFDCGTL